MNLSKNVLVIGSSIGVATAASSSINSPWIDTQGFSGCMCVVRGSTLAVSSGAHRVYAIHAASKSSASEGKLGYIASSSGAHVATAGTNRNYVVDIYKPTKRYVRFRVDNSSAGTYEFVPILYGPKRPGSTACDANATTSLYASTCIVGKTTNRG
jgi:hypothetical protein